ncbi:MAG: hypothetical protein MJ164_03390, partial [Alphaproteobacteria bacterium]|nr:hypothetical protein [Alphaproteobacteria bacterium]
HIFLRVFSKITIFACVFCAFSAWADTTTCDIDYIPVTGNSIQNGTPTPTNPVEIESVGTKVGNKYAVQVAVNYDGGVVDLGTLNWVYLTTGSVLAPYFYASISNFQSSGSVTNFYCNEYKATKRAGLEDKTIFADSNHTIEVRDLSFSDAAAFKKAMSGKYLYYQRATDETWVAPTLKTVYLDEPLRKVGEYADVLDYKNGTITRNVGVKVLDGTESWGLHSINQYGIANFNTNLYHKRDTFVLTTHLLKQTALIADAKSEGVLLAAGSTLYIRRFASQMSTPADFKSWLAEQYANGTPVTVYYPLETPVVEQIENWSCIPPITDIKIATTKFVDDEFAQAEANLAATVQTIESVVSRTIAQTGQIATLHETKQTRPDESCPANMKCLLVQDEDGTPHWYPIIEP